VTFNWVGTKLLLLVAGSSILTEYVLQMNVGVILTVAIALSSEFSIELVAWNSSTSEGDKKLFSEALSSLNFDWKFIDENEDEDSIYELKCN
jgi:hypothetical protein